LTGSKSGINPFWSSSQLHDEQLDMDSYLYRNLFRGIQRWGSQDPAGLAGGINAYGFVRNNPLRLIDPDGKAPQVVGATYDSTIALPELQYQDQQFGQGYGIGAHSSLDDPIGEMVQDLDEVWNYGLDQITPPIDPNQNPYAYAASQTAREMALAALLTIATDRIGGVPKAKPCPPNVKTIANNAHAKGSPIPGYKGGRPFANDGRNGGQVLPRIDAQGNPIHYREWDVNPYQPGVNRGAERVVTGSDGSSYYTDNHYTTFTPVFWNTS